MGQYSGAINAFPEECVVLNEKKHAIHNTSLRSPVLTENWDLLTGKVLTRFQLSFCVRKLEMPQPCMICGSWAE